MNAAPQKPERPPAPGRKAGPGRPKTSERDDQTAKVDRALMSRAKAVAAFRNIPVAELLSDLLTGPLDKAFAAMLRELEAREAREAKGKGGRAS